MLQIVVFSFNRAIQLDTLLTSFVKYWVNPPYQMDVIYNTSSPFFQKGYDLLMEKYKGNSGIRFYKESKECRPYTAKEIMLSVGNVKRLLLCPFIRNPKSNFRPLLIQLMEDSVAREIMFMTDDAMYIHPVNLTNEVFDWIEQNPHHRQFSLRLGKGMNNQPIAVRESTSYLEWNLKSMPHMTNWGYYFSVDAHIYSKQLILNYFKRYIFVNPNSLEGYIESRIRGKVEYGRSFKEAKVLSFPINMVQTVSKNEHLGVSVEKLNRYYLDGYTLNILFLQLLISFKTTLII